MSSLALVLIMNFQFAMKYLSAALKLPVIIQIFQNGSKNRLMQANCSIWAINFAYYLTICFWLALFQFP